MPLLVVALFPLTLYSVAINCNIYNVARLFSPFFVVSLSAFLTCLRLPSARSRLTLLVVSCLELTYYAYNFQPGLRGCLDNPPMKAEQNIASTLAQLNIGPGSPVAEVDPLRKYYWARIAKVKVISEVLDYQGFLDNYEKHKTEILSSWAQAGVKAVVLRLPDAGQLDKIPKDWIRVSNDTDFILVIPHLIQSRSQGVKDD